MAENKIFNRDDDQIVLDSVEPRKLSEVPTEFKRLTIQNSSGSADLILVGGEDPKIELQPGSDEKYYNGYLNQMYITPYRD